MKSLFVTGTDTGVGKTWISALLIRAFIRRGIQTGAYKPACSGVEFDNDGRPFWADVETLRAALGGTIAPDQICPQRFRAPVAPNEAARSESRQVDDSLLLAGIDVWRNSVDWLIVEGAGGVYCPLSDRSTVMDLAQRLNGPVVVVAANRLGVINHTVLTVRAIEARSLKIAAVILNEVHPPNLQEKDESIRSNASQLQHWLPDIPLFHCEWMSETLSSCMNASTPALEQLFQQLTPCA